MKQKIYLVALFAALGACSTTVSLTAEGRKVRVESAPPPPECERISPLDGWGWIVKQAVWVFDTPEGLHNRMQNKAARRGVNYIHALPGAPLGLGYRCPDAKPVPAG